MINKELIQKLKDGTHCIEYDGKSLDKLKEIFKECGISEGNYKFLVGSSILYKIYFHNTLHKYSWYSDSSCIQDKIPIADFFIEELPEKWYIRGSKDLKNYFKEIRVGNLDGDNIEGYYFKDSEDKWDFTELPSDSGHFCISKYTEITLQQYLNSLKNKSMKSDTILFSPSQMQRIIDISCTTWKPRLAKDFGEYIVLSKQKDVTRERFNEYIKACTPKQLEVFKELFPNEFKPDIKRDTVVYVKNKGASQEWQMRFFKEYDKDGNVRCYTQQRKSTETSESMSWDYYSLTNPLI